MQLDFFPSRTLTLYLAKMFVVRILAVLVMLVLVLLALDLLAATGDILAAQGNGQAEILEYAALRAPQLASRFLPYSVLAGDADNAGDAEPEQRGGSDEGSRPQRASGARPAVADRRPGWRW